MLLPSKYREYVAKHAVPHKQYQHYRTQSPADLLQKLLNTLYALNVRRVPDAVIAAPAAVSAIDDDATAAIDDGDEALLLMIVMLLLPVILPCACFSIGRWIPFVSLSNSLPNTLHLSVSGKLTSA